MLHTDRAIKQLRKQLTSITAHRAM